MQFALNVSRCVPSKHCSTVTKMSSSGCANEIVRLILLTWLEHLLGVFLLIVLWPLGLLVAVLLRTTSSGPVILKDEIAMVDGRMVHGYRFRTTGNGTAVFHCIGRFLRRFNVDEYPSPWAVAQGEMRFSEFMNISKLR